MYCTSLENIISEDFYARLLEKIIVIKTFSKSHVEAESVDLEPEIGVSFLKLLILSV